MDKKFKTIGGYQLDPISYYIKEFNHDFYMGMHKHGYFEFMYANRGNFDLEILRDVSRREVEIYTVKQGEFVFIDAYTFHRLRVNEDNVVIYNMEFEPKSPSDFNPHNINSIFPVNYEKLIENTLLKNIANTENGFAIYADNGKVDTIFREFISALTRQEYSIENACSVQCYMILFLMEIAKCTAKNSTGNLSYIKQALIFIKQNFRTKLSLDDVAKKVGLHKVYLATQFKNHTGKTVVETINSLRVSKCLQLLRDSNLSVSDIARHVGFSYAQMSYEFKKLLRLSPSEYRKYYINDEVDHTYELYKSLSIKVDNVDFILDDEVLHRGFYKKSVDKQKKIIELPME